MKSREDVIRGLNEEVKRADYIDTEYLDCVEVSVLRDALALLKAQEPVEPKLDVDEWRCGNCGHKLEHQELLGDNVLFHEQYNYCPNCGRAVKFG